MRPDFHHLNPDDHYNVIPIIPTEDILNDTPKQMTHMTKQKKRQQTQEPWCKFIIDRYISYLFDLIGTLLAIYLLWKKD